MTQIHDLFDDPRSAGSLEFFIFIWSHHPIYPCHSGSTYQRKQGASGASLTRRRIQECNSDAEHGRGQGNAGALREHAARRAR